MNSQRKNVLGIPIDIYRPQDLVSIIERDFQNSPARTIFAVNPEKIMLAQRDLDLSLAMKEADFLIPDGIGTLVALRFLYGEKISRAFRVTGIELMQCLLSLAARRKYKIFIFGASPEVNSKVAVEVPNCYPGLELVGYSHGYISEQEYGFLIESINSLEPDMLFVGLGSPKQEKWIYNYQKILRVKICMGIGGSLDVIAGKFSRAPLWMRRSGLEWLYRLIREPSRIKRQMALPKFAMKVVSEKLSSRKPI